MNSALEPVISTTMSNSDPATATVNTIFWVSR